MTAFMPVSSLKKLEDYCMLWDAGDQDKPLGTQVGEAHHRGEPDSWLCYSHSTPACHWEAPKFR